MAQDSPKDRPAERLAADGWAGVAAIEFSDYVLFPDKLLRRRASGEIEEQPIYLRVPREHEFRAARVRARGIANEERLDLDRDADLVKNVENVCLLTVAIRNCTPPYEPFEPDPGRLERVYDRVCLARLWERVDEANAKLNPSPDSISQDEMFALIAKLAMERTLDPLVGYGSGARTSLVVFMADLLVNSLASKLSPASSAPSTLVS